VSPDKRQPRGAKASEEGRILLAHGGGGSMSGALVRDVFVSAFANEPLARLGDAAILPVVNRPDPSLAFTTDSYVVSPLFFPGGDIGRLAVAGTVNDLAVSGAEPLYLSAAFILEEGFPLGDLRRVAASMASTAREAGVLVVTGDTKVVARGEADGLYITTSGVGLMRLLPPAWGRPEPGDAVLVNGTLGDHGFTVLAAREGLSFQTELTSDCAPLNGLIDDLFSHGLDLRFLRDATRGGLAAVLNEVLAHSPLGIDLREQALPVAPAVCSLSEILGIDPLYVANEGKFVAIVGSADAESALELMRAHPLGRKAAIIGAVVRDRPGFVTMTTRLGGQRIVDMPLGEQLPRIC
jgi:hydrogenase expression/formation protein HypE